MSTEGFGLTEQQRANLRRKVRLALIATWSDDYSVSTVVDALASAIEPHFADLLRAHAERAWTEGFDRGFYDPLAGHGAIGRDASESAATNPYARQERDRD
jgi:hypothetical protein